MTQSLTSLIITQLMGVVFFLPKNKTMLNLLIAKSDDLRDSMFLTVFVICDFQVKIMNISWVTKIFQVVGHVLLDDF